MALTCSLEATYLQQIKGEGRDAKMVYLPIIARRDKPGQEEFKIIRIEGARQHNSPKAATKVAEKALRRLWKFLMKATV